MNSPVLAVTAVQRDEGDVWFELPHAVDQVVADVKTVNLMAAPL